jgi:poly(hydroxyalkanoate) depolymerase family esterase
LLLLAASTAHANSYSGPVDKALWATDVPSYIDMFIAVPDVMPEKPPIIVNIHSCGNSAGGQWSYEGFAPLRDAIDSIGYIMIIPQQTRNCWNVGAPESLTHGGGGDTGAIVQMVQYVIETYNADPTRVYAMGGSGGGMAVQALLAVYPEVFKAGHARAGVPAGCWAEGYDDGQQWSNSCAGGSVDKTPEEWGDYVRAINPDYTGPRPRIQINQGNQDTTISFNNFRESIDEWTNVLGLDAMPTRTDQNFMGAEANYNRQFWDDACGYTVLEMWEALNMGHSMGYESVHILEFFGLDQVREQDPWDEACGGMTDPVGSAGASGVGGMDAAGGETAMGGTGPIAEPMGGMGASVGGASGAGVTGGTPGVEPGMPEGGAAPIGTPGPTVTAPAGTGTTAPGATATAAPPATTAPGVVAPSTTPPATSDSAMIAAAGAGPTGLVPATDESTGGDSGGCRVAAVAAPPSSRRMGPPALLLLALGLTLCRRRAA